LRTKQTNRPGDQPNRGRGDRQRPSGPGRGPGGSGNSERRGPGGSSHGRGPDGGRGPRPPRREPLPQLPAGHEFIYGRNAVAEALRGKREVFGLTFAEGIRLDDRLRQIEALATERGLSTDRAPRELLDALAPANHQGVLLEAGAYPYAEIDDIQATPGTVLILDHLQDPQNFGTLIRAAEAAGVSGVIIPENRSAEITPAVVNASAGAVELLPVSVVPNLSNAIKALQSAGWWIAALDSGDDAVDIQQADLPLPIALIIGSEGGGISSLLRKNADLVLSIPMVGRIESLNAATAGSIAIYEVFRRQRLSEGTQS
jgi:23S rRNA (guanosine2251-2'-O)-methyltransferase